MAQYWPLAQKTTSTNFNPLIKLQWVVNKNTKSNVVTKSWNTLIWQAQKQETSTTEKPKFNLFDFSTLQVSKPQVQWATWWWMMPPTTSWQALPQTPQKSTFSSWLVPQASAGERFISKDELKSIIDKRPEWVTPEDILTWLSSKYTVEWYNEPTQQGQPTQKQEKGLLDFMWWELKWAYEKALSSTERWVQKFKELWNEPFTPRSVVKWVVWTADIVTAPIQWAVWQWLETFVWKPIKEVYKATVPTDIQKAIESWTVEWIKKVTDWYNSQDNNTKQLMKDLWLAWEYGSYIIWLKWTKAVAPKIEEWLAKVWWALEGWAVKWWQILEKWAINTWKTLIKWWKILSKASWKVWEWVVATWEYWTKLATWLERETQQLLKNAPKTYKAVKAWEITAEKLATDVKTNISKRLTDLSETWKLYDKVKSSPVKFSKKEVQWIYDTTLKNEWIGKNLVELPLEDRSAIKQAQAYLNETKWDLTSKQAVELKAKLRSLVSYDKWVSPNWERIVKNIIKDLDNNMKTKIPWYKELDSVYWPEREFLDKVSKDILNKDWTLKDNAISTIRNITWKWKEFKLERLEKIMPWITEKVKAIKAYEDVQNAISWKVWWYTRWALLWWWWYVAWWPIWALATFIITHPTVAENVLLTYWIAKEWVKNLVNKIVWKKLLTTTEQNTIKKAFKLPKEEIEKKILLNK